jgi:hypothetical protein
MENTKITKRMRYEALIAMIEAGALDTITDYNADITADSMKDFCVSEIELLDKKADKAKERAATKAAAGDALTETIKTCLTSKHQTIADITNAVAAIDPEVTTSKVTYRLSQLLKNGVVTKGEVVVPGVDGAKSRKLQTYAIA